MSQTNPAQRQAQLHRRIARLERQVLNAWDISEWHQMRNEIDQLTLECRALQSGGGNESICRG